MNKVVYKRKLKRDVLNDKCDFESRICNSLKYNIINVLKEYFYVDENKSLISIQVSENGDLKFNFCCVIKDL